MPTPLTKMHFDEITKAIRDCYFIEEYDRSQIAEILADALSQFNKRFDRDLFIKDCLEEKENVNDTR